MKKKFSWKRKLVIAVLVATVLVAAAILTVPVLGFGAEQTGSSSSMISVQAQYGNITTSVSGSGSVEAGSNITISLPAGIKLDTIYVEAGDTVAKGDLLAKADIKSVADAISDMEDALSEIDKEIEDIDDDGGHAEIQSSVSGRIKAIYVAEGDNVQDVVAGHGALMLISVDGKMKVSFETAQQLSTGDDVEVLLTDGSAVAGEVAGISDGQCTVTLTDNGPTLDEEAKVFFNDVEIGSGKLEINTPVEVINGNGGIDSIDVELDEKVDKGDTLLTLSQTTASISYSKIKAKRDDYTDVLRQLYALHTNGEIVSDLDGTISEVILSAANTASDKDDTSGNSDNGIIPATGTSDISAGNSTIMLLNKTNQTLIRTDVTEIPEATGSEMAIAISGEVTLPLAAPITGQKPQTIISEAAYSAAVSWQPNDEIFMAGTTYTATVVLTVNEGYVFANGVSFKTDMESQPKISITVSGDSTLMLVVEYEALPAATPAPTNDDTATPTPSNSTDKTGGSGSSGDSIGSDGTGSSGGISGSGSQASSPQVQTLANSSQETDDNDSSESDLSQSFLTVSSSDSYKLTVNVDELDILSLSSGQQVSVVLDALPDEVFTGTVNKVSESGSSQSGVTTYPVSISLDTGEDTAIMAGMNASVTIITDSVENVLIIPMVAVQEMRGEQYVFVAGETDNEESLGERRQISTGLSDGTFVEVLSGLEEGESISYTETTLTGTNFSEDNGGINFSGGGMPGGGSGPVFRNNGNGGGSVPEGMQRPQ